jgi:ferric-dicitrate binding protein FerR (iron transport regulator)
MKGQYMDSDSKFWLGIWSVAALVVITLALVVSNNYQKANEQIRTAPTCEAAVLLQGGANVELRLMICAVGKDSKKAPQ